MNADSIKKGIYGGLAGGVVFGAMMGMMGMLPMIGSMVGSPSAFAGFLLHMVNSAIIGAAFGIVLGSMVSGMGNGLGYGLGYGVIWWLLGPLTLMPLFMGMGMGVNWNLEAAGNMMPSLMGHLVYGAILGAVYAWMGTGQRADGSSDSADFEPLDSGGPIPLENEDQAPPEEAASRDGEGTETGNGAERPSGPRTATNNILD